LITSSLPQLRLLQLASSTLPVGAFSYSEGLEHWVEQGALSSAQELEDWLVQELSYGSIRMELGIVLRGYQAALDQDAESLLYWNHWWSAARESEELRLQSWQMGRSLLRLWLELNEVEAGKIDKTWPVLQTLKTQTCNFAIAFGLAAADWHIQPTDALLGYLQSWSTNLMTTGVKLIPLGQTAGQQILLNLGPLLASTVQAVQQPDTDLESCGWGLALASMAHETQYSRLFRS
jgi:urease accessory protein